MQIRKKIWGSFGEGRLIYLIEICSGNGSFIRVTNLGATLVSVVVPDAKGNQGDIVLGYNSPDAYLGDQNYMGSTIGRFANRIKNASFTIGNKHYSLEANEGKNINHGGINGFHKKLWDTEIIDNGVLFSYFSKDGDSGFPGNVDVSVRYLFSEDMEMTIQYESKSDRETYLNLTNHAYFNLDETGSVLLHSLYIPFTSILETDCTFIPTGRQLDVRNTPFDFTSPRILGKQIFTSHEQLIPARGYNQYYISPNFGKNGMMLFCRLFGPHKGRVLEMFSDLPGFILYTGNFLNSDKPGKSGDFYKPYDGICLEAQYYPDTPNHEKFPSCLITPEVPYRHSVIYRFLTVPKG